MQQYDVPRKKRRIMLFIRYVLMTIAVAAISVVCVLLALGYRFNLTSRSVEQGALLQFGTYPNGANITLDGEQLSFTTDGKREVKVGAHDIVFHKDGYRNWTKQVTVKAGEVRWLNYVRLVPTTVSTSTVKELSNFAQVLPSPDRSYVMILNSSTSPDLTLINVKDSTKVTTASIAVPVSILKSGVKTTAFRLIEWNYGSRYVLLKHEFEGGSEYIRVGLTPEAADNAINLSGKFGVTFSDIHFSTESVFYGVENGNLRKFDLGASSLSEPFVKEIVAMQLYGLNNLAYVRHADTKYEVGVVKDSKPHTVNTYDDTTPLLIDYTRYFDEYYLAITRGASFEIVKNPEKTAKEGMVKVVTLSYPNDLKWLDISSNGRFVIAGNGAKFMTYDLELKARTDANFPSLLTDPSIKPQWLDDYLLVSSGDNKLRLSDYDGENQQIITDVSPAQPVMLSQNSKLLYSISRTSTGTIVLQSSKMTTD